MVSGIILASGFSKRMGQDKLLLQLDQSTIVEKVIHAALKSTLDEVILVYREDAVKIIAASYPIKPVHNEDAERGQSTSVIKGINATDPATGAYLFMVGDQPFLDAATIDRLIARHANHPGHIIVPTYDGCNGNPVLFPSSFKSELLKVRGDRGGRAVIDTADDRITYVPIERPDIGYDVDTPEDFSRIKSLHPSR